MEYSPQKSPTIKITPLNRLIEARYQGQLHEKCILGIDPGETTGLCAFRGIELTKIDQVRTITTGKYNWDVLEKTFDALKPEFVVCENYRIYSHKLSRHEYSEVPTLRLIGGISLLCHQREIPIYYQMATQAKGFVTDKKLLEWFPTLSIPKHAKDAVRHVIYFLLFGLLKDKRLEAQMINKL